MPPATPVFEIGKHNWSGGNMCVICGLVRDLVQEEEEVYIYEVGGDWGRAPMACAPRLVEPFPGFYTSKDMCETLSLSASKLTTLAQTNRIFPAAVSRNNVYYWRVDHLGRFKAVMSKKDIERSKANDPDLWATEPQPNTAKSHSPSFFSQWESVIKGMGRT